ncbi:MAG: hypothetical protein ACXVBB_17680 [Isosphaeraceae bacterium]
MSGSGDMAKHDRDAGVLCRLTGAALTGMVEIGQPSDGRTRGID